MLPFCPRPQGRAIAYDRAASAENHRPSRRVLAGGIDGSIRLWDVASGALVRKFTGHNGLVRSVAFAALKLLARGRRVEVNCRCIACAVVRKDGGTASRATPP